MQQQNQINNNKNNAIINNNEGIQEKSILVYMVKINLLSFSYQFVSIVVY